jgi:hypothetical protein
MPTTISVFLARTQAEDPYGILKYFTSYRIFRSLDRSCCHYLLGVAGQILTRDFMDEMIEKPLKSQGGYLQEPRVIWLMP